MFLEAQLLVADDRNGVEDYVFRLQKGCFWEGGFGEEFVSREGGHFVSLNLPTSKVREIKVMGDMMMIN